MESKNILQYYIEAFTLNYTRTKGRARRKEFWSFFLVHILALIGFSMLGELIRFPNIILVYYLVATIPYFCIFIRRMHDNGKSGWFMFIPSYNFVLLVSSGEVGSNEYGPDPKLPVLDEIGEIGKPLND